MPTLPSVSDRHWERVARDFDDIGPEACVAEIMNEMRANNPRYLAIARRCARDTEDPTGTFTGFAKFYAVVALGAHEHGRAVPRIASQTLDVIDTLVQEFGEDCFVTLATELLWRENASLAAMAHSFASPRPDYLTIMQGFAVLYNCLSMQGKIDSLSARATRH